MAKRGRKPLDYQKHIVQLEQVLSSGATVKDACAYVGVSQETFYLWLRSYPEFSEVIEKARAQGKVECVALIRRAARENWQAAAWFLERSDAHNWGRKDSLKIEGGITPEQVNRLVRAAVSAGVSAGDAFEELIREFEQANRTDRPGTAAGEGE